MTLPATITHQDQLLSIDTKSGKFLEGLLHPGLKIFPFFIDRYNGMAVYRAKFAPGITLPLHFHTGSVHLYTLSGCWYYSEYPEQKQTAGCYLYEPGGSIHQFVTPPDNEEDTDTFIVITGCNVNFGEDGQYLGLMDAGWLSAWIDQAAVEQGASGMKYISVGIPSFQR